MVNYFPYDYAAPRQRRAAVQARRCRGVPDARGTPGRKLVRIGIKGYALPARDAAARQPRLPDRHLGLDGRAQQAAAAQAVARHAGRSAATRNDTVVDRHLCRHRRRRARADHGQPTRRKILAALDKLGAGGSTAGAEGIRQAYELAEQNFDPERRQPRDPRDRRRLQRRHHQPGRAEGLHRARARQGRLPVGARLRHGQSTTTR